MTHRGSMPIPGNIAQQSIAAPSLLHKIRLHFFLIKLCFQAELEELKNAFDLFDRSHTGKAGEKEGERRVGRDRRKERGGWGGIDGQTRQQT